MAAHTGSEIRQTVTVFHKHTNFNLGGVEFRRHGVSDEVELSSV